MTTPGFHHSTQSPLGWPRRPPSPGRRVGSRFQMPHSGEGCLRLRLKGRGQREADTQQQENPGSGGQHAQAPVRRPQAVMSRSLRPALLCTVSEWLAPGSNHACLAVTASTVVVSLSGRVGFFGHDGEEVMLWKSFAN